MPDQPPLGQLNVSQTVSRLPAEGESLSKHGNAKGADYRIDLATGCWEWLKSKSAHGYGRVSVNGKGAWAYRAYYEAAYGPIPAGHDVHHKCENPGCVNPEHLEALTEREHDVVTWLDKLGLTLEDVRTIRQLGREGWSSHDVAARYGISHWTVREYWSSRGTRWMDLLGEDGPKLIKPIRDCDWCGKSMGPVQRNRRYCDIVCKRAANKPRRSR